MNSAWLPSRLNPRLPPEPKTDLPSKASGALRNNPGEIPAGCARQRGEVHFAEDIFNVAGIDGGGLDLDKDFAGSGDGPGNVLNREKIQRAGFFESQSAHSMVNRENLRSSAWWRQ